MKLFHAPGSCSLGIRILLELAEARYELVTLSLANGEQRSPSYLAQNPKGKVPALGLPDGTVLTEFPVIAQWIAAHFPKAGLLPEGEAAFRALEVMEYVVSSLHMRGSTLVLKPEKFAPSPQGQAYLRDYGRQVIDEGLTLLAQKLGDKPYFFERVSLADAAVFYLINWHERLDFRLPATLAAFHQRMAALPAVARALA